MCWSSGFRNWPSHRVREYDDRSHHRAGVNFRRQRLCGARRGYRPVYR